MEKVALNLVVIRSADLERAARFYGSLGIDLIRDRHGSGPEHLAGRVGAVLLEIYPASKGDDTKCVRLGFRVLSIANALGAVLESGGTVATPPQDSPWGLRAVVVDPDGHRLELTQE